MPEKFKVRLEEQFRREGKGEPKVRNQGDNLHVGRKRETFLFTSLPNVILNKKKKNNQQNTKNQKHQNKNNPPKTNTQDSLVEGISSISWGTRLDGKEEYRAKKP